MLADTVTLSVAEHIATITISRPEKLNALSAQVILELGQAIDAARERADVAGVILTGAGRAFVAGGDLAEVEKSNVLSARERARRGQHVFRQFETSPKPTIAAVNGYALGGGCELAMACHIRIASDAARFGQPEAKVGVVPGYGGTQRLPRLVGRGRALEMLLTGELIDAHEAYRIGLVNRVVPPDQLIPAATSMLMTILANGPGAVAACIEAVNTGYNLSLGGALALETAAFGLVASSDAQNNAS
jgi:enoyl-CoA hydratase